MGKKDKRMVPALEVLAEPTTSPSTLEKQKKRKKQSSESSEQKVKKLKREDANGAVEEVGKTEKKKKSGVVSGQSEPIENGSNGVVKHGTLKKKKIRNSEEPGVVDLRAGEESGAALAEEGGKKKKKKEKSGVSSKGTEPENGAVEQETDGRKKKKKRRDDGEIVEDLQSAEKKKKKKDKASNGLSSGGDLAKARAELNMVVTGREADTDKFRPLQTFAEANLPETLLHGCVGFTTPSPIQAQAWPIALAGRDLIGIAKTGSGKTIAFAVPALSYISKLGKPPKSPACLVLAPTRELAIQIAEVFENAGKKCGIKTVCVYGGVPKGPQKAAIRGGATVVVATPGRLQDLLEEGACTLAQCGMLVLDEADRMLDLGFEPAIRKIIGLLPKSHQTSMFSATWPPEVAKLAAEFLRVPLKITIGSEDLTANHDVHQIVEVCEPTGREPKLEQLLRKYHADRKNRVLVFVLYKKEAAQMESYLQRKGWTAVAIHGDKGQADRSRALQQFRDGTIPLLIATDVAARGLDIPNVEYVINYSFPLTAEDYVHRIGRTGRAGKKGIAHTFFTVNDKARAGELQNILREAGQEVPAALTAFGTTVKKKESKLYGAHFREVDMEAKATKISFDSDED